MHGSTPDKPMSSPPRALTAVLLRCPLQPTSAIEVKATLSRVADRQPDGIVEWSSGPVDTDSCLPREVFSLRSDNPTRTASFIVGPDLTPISTK